MTQNELRAAVDGVMSHQWSNTQEAMTALQVLVDEAHKASDEIERLRALVKQMGEALQIHRPLEVPCPKVEAAIAGVNGAKR